MDNSFDIIILGGGIAGCIAAMHLSSFYKVLVIEKSLNSKILHGETLVPSIKKIFHELGLNLESIFENSPHLGIPNLGMQSFWGSEECVFTDALRNPDGNSWSIDKPVFSTYLQNLVRSKRVNFIRADVQKLDITPRDCSVIIKDVNSIEKKYNSLFIIDTTGRRRLISQRLNIPIVKKDQLISIHASVNLDNKNELSTIYPVKYGWWYISKLPNQKHLLSFFTDADLIEKKYTKDSEAFKTYFLEQNRLANHLDVNTNELNFEFLGTKASHSSCLNIVGENNWLAIGDAYMTFDPLSSQGLFNAMAMAAQFSKLIIQSNVVHTLSEEVRADFFAKCQRMADDIWSHYEYHYFVYYNTEKRWADETFWRRRQKV